MNTRREILIVLIMSAFVASLISRDAYLNASNVTIVAIDEHHLVVSRTVNGRTEHLRFTLNDETVRTGNLIAGARISVHYVTRNHENIATSIQSLQRH